MIVNYNLHSSLGCCASYLPFLLIQVKYFNEKWFNLLRINFHKELKMNEMSYIILPTYMDMRGDLDVGVVE